MLRLSLFVAVVTASFAVSQAKGTVITTKNKCNFTVWPGEHRFIDLLVFC